MVKIYFFLLSLGGLGSPLYTPRVMISLLVIGMQNHFSLKKLIRYLLFGKYSSQGDSHYTLRLTSAKLYLPIFKINYLFY